MSPVMEARLRSSARSSNSSPTWKNSMTNTASGNWLSAKIYNKIIKNKK
jgi:hypothetical protein